MDLKELRDRIDEIDRQLLPLFLERMDMTSKVADYKREHNMAILDKAREREVLESKLAMLTDKSRENDVYEFFSCVMSISRDAQTHALYGMDTVKKLDDLISFGERKENPRIVYAGVEGAYAEQAAAEYFGEDSDRRPVHSFEDVLRAIESGKGDCGVVPVENSSTGSISETLDLLSKYNLYIIGEQYVEVNHCLLGNRGASIHDIKTIYSHEQGFLQSSEYLKRYPHIKREVYYNTAAAAEMVAKSGDISKAAIASRRNAELYGLDILAENINYSSKNTTRFLIIANRAVCEKDADKISAAFTLPHEAGMLHRVLATFAHGGLNLTRIESRPVREHNFEYRFFVDYTGNLADENVRRITENVIGQASEFRILGNYRAGEHK